MSISLLNPIKTNYLYFKTEKWFKNYIYMKYTYEYIFSYKD